MGIGLALVKTLVTMHGGTVCAVSEGRGKGAEFIVSLPLAHTPLDVEPDVHEREGAPVPTGSLEILIVEDNRDAAETLADLLQLEGHRTRLAFDGESGMKAFQERAPDVVICDVGLPDVSGHELIRRIRGLEGGRRVFAVALTGYALAEDIEHAMEAGFDAHLAKPAPLDRVDALLAQAAQRGS
jgi:CheY-like chemotaxis protein